MCAHICSADVFCDPYHLGKNLNQESGVSHSVISPQNFGEKLGISKGFCLGGEVTFQSAWGEMVLVMCRREEGEKKKEKKEKRRERERVRRGGVPVPEKGKI